METHIIETIEIVLKLSDIDFKSLNKKHTITFQVHGMIYNISKDNTPCFRKGD